MSESQIRIEAYTPGQCEAWNRFVAEARNGTFLFDRGYMDYHADRFRDCSWMAYRNGKLVALLPANIKDDGTLQSHGGLTYGGWILRDGHLDGADLLDIFEEAVKVWRSAGISQLDYKPLPYIYADRPSQEDLYALQRLGAEMTGCGLSEAVAPSQLHLNTLQRRHLRKAGNVKITETDSAAPVMDLVSACLAERHNAAPVHTAAEMQMLKDRFPDNIRFFTVTLPGNDNPLEGNDNLDDSADMKVTPDAAVCIYDTGRVAHCQYIATSSAGRELNLLTPLFYHLISEVFSAREWFDFGTSNESDGSLNRGLLRQKASYGASAVIYPRFSLKL